MSLEEKTVLFGFEFQSLEILATHSLTFYLHSFPLSSSFPDSLLSFLILFFLTLTFFSSSFSRFNSLSHLGSLPNECFLYRKDKETDFQIVIVHSLTLIQVSSGLSHSTHPLFFTHPLSHLLMKQEGRKRMEEGRKGEERMEEGRKREGELKREREWKRILRRSLALFSRFLSRFSTPSILTCLSAH